MLSFSIEILAYVLGSFIVSHLAFVLRFISGISAGVDQSRIHSLAPTAGSTQWAMPPPPARHMPELFEFLLVFLLSLSW